MTYATVFVLLQYNAGYISLCPQPYRLIICPVLTWESWEEYAALVWQRILLSSGLAHSPGMQWARSAFTAYTGVGTLMCSLMTLQDGADVQGTDDYNEVADEEDEDEDDGDEDEVALPESMTLEVCILKENKMQVLM